MTDPDDPTDDSHAFSEGQGFDDPYEGFDLEPPELAVDPGQVDPVDSRVIADSLDERQLADDEVDADQLVDVGIEYLQINRFEEATETLERAAQFADADAIAQEAWVNKGVAHAELEEWDAAIGAYREAIDLDAAVDHTAVAETNLAYALWESGRTAQALDHAERAVELDSRFARGWYNRGFFLFERGLTEEAVDCFNNATRLGFRTPELLEQKAQALEELGEYDEAEELVAEADALRAELEDELVQ